MDILKAVFEGRFEGEGDSPKQREPTEEERQAQRAEQYAKGEAALQNLQKLTVRWGSSVKEQPRKVIYSVLEVEACLRFLNQEISSAQEECEHTVTEEKEGIPYSIETCLHCGYTELI